MKKDDILKTTPVENGLLTQDDIKNFDETYERHKELFKALAKDD